MKLKNVILPIIVLATLATVFSSCEDKGQVVTGMVPSVKIHQLNISKHSLNFSSDSQSGNVTISSPSTVWEFTDIPSWISISPSTGSGSDTDIKVSVKKNEVTTSRVGVITLRSLEEDWNYSTQLTVTQEGCSFYATPQKSSIAFDGKAGSLSVPVVSNTGTWTVSVPGNASYWCSAAKNGNSVTVTVTANTSNVSRSVSIEVTTSESCEYVSVTQRPANISSTTEQLVFPVGGGTESVQVQAEAAWTAQTSYSWIDVTPQSGQSGTSTVSVQALSNNTTQDRTGYVYLELSDKNRIEIPVQQEGIHFSIDKTDMEFPVTASSAELQVLSNVPWQFADGIPEWITVTPSSGTGNAVVTVNVTGHNSADPRQAKLSISPTAVDSPCEIDIFQAGHTLEADSTSLHFSSRAGQLTFNLESDAQWVAGSSDTWISVSPASGFGSQTINVNVTANESETARTGSVVIGIDDKTVTVPVYQAGQYISVSSKALDFTSKGGSTQVSLSSDTDWKIESGADWLTASVSSGSDNASVTITAGDNPSSASRSSKVTVTSPGLTPVSIAVSQAARYLRTSVDTLIFFGKGGTSDAVLIETDGVCEITNTAPWITVNRLSSTQFTVTATDYTEGSEDREATLTLSLTDVTSGTVSRNIVITQSLKAQPQYVDLGLSVLWATFNVGAVSQEDYGDYFAWGETSPKTNYSWSTCKYCNGSEDYLTKYCTDSYYGTIDNKTVLDLSDDAARVLWGGRWRMPTRAEFEELVNGCTWTWTTQNGVNGYKVVSKNNSNCIFLPAAGCCNDANLSYAGDGGNYWSRSLDENNPVCSWFLNFGLDNHATYNYGSRYSGHSVRPVHPVAVTGVSLSSQSLELTEHMNSTLTAMVSPSRASDYTVYWSSSNTSVATVDQTGTVAAVSIGTCFITATCENCSATCSVTVKADPHQFVDLGLSVKWATCNVGAYSPEEYGDYYAWGENIIKDQYSISNYEHYNSEGYTFIGDDISGTEYDVVSVCYGNGWRMPSTYEFEELLEGTDYEWIENYNETGVNGYKFTSRTNPDNFIFLPAAGYKYGTGTYYQDELGYYASGSLFESSGFEYAWSLHFGMDHVSTEDDGFSQTSYYYRYYGRSIRPVFSN